MLDANSKNGLRGLRGFSEGLEKRLRGFLFFSFNLLIVKREGCEGLPRMIQDLRCHCGFAPPAPSTCTRAPLSHVYARATPSQPSQECRKPLRHSHNARA